MLSVCVIVQMEILFASGNSGIQPDNMANIESQLLIFDVNGEAYLILNLTLSFLINESSCVTVKEVVGGCCYFVTYLHMIARFGDSSAFKLHL